MISAPARTHSLTSASDPTRGFPAATFAAGSAHARTLARSASASTSRGTTRSDPLVAFSTSASSTSTGRSASSASRASSTHARASSTASSSASSSSHRAGTAAPTTSAFSASSSVGGELDAPLFPFCRAGRKSAAASAAHAVVSSAAASRAWRSFGCTGSPAASRLSRARSANVGSSALLSEALCLRPGSAFLARSLHACAAATASFSRRADVTSSGPRAVSAASDTHFFGFGCGRSPRAWTTRCSRSSAARSASANAAESAAERGNGAASRS